MGTMRAASMRHLIVPTASSMHNVFWEMGSGMRRTRAQLPFVPIKGNDRKGTKVLDGLDRENFFH
jgi:hypothetical protein